MSPSTTGVASHMPIRRVRGSPAGREGDSPQPSITGWRRRKRGLFEPRRGEFPSAPPTEKHRASAVYGQGAEPERPARRARVPPAGREGDSPQPSIAGWRRRKRGVFEPRRGEFPSAPPAEKHRASAVRGQGAEPGAALPVAYDSPSRLRGLPVAHEVSRVRDSMSAASLSSVETVSGIRPLSLQAYRQPRCLLLRRHPPARAGPAVRRGPSAGGC